MNEGMAVARQVLAAVGIRFPRTTLGTVVVYLWFRCLLWFRGLGYVPRSETDVPPEQLVRIDICRSMGDIASYANMILGALFHTRGLLLALRSGEVSRVAHALSVESSHLGANGPRVWARTRRVMELAREAAERAGTPAAQGEWLTYVGGGYAFSLHYREAIEHLQRGIATLRGQVPGSTWEVTAARFFLINAYHYTCRYTEQRAEQEAALKDALARGDAYAALTMRVGALNRIWWMGGDPARSRRELAEAERSWPRPAGSFDLLHLHLLVAHTYVDLYEGHGRAGIERVVASWPALERSLALVLEPLRLEALTMRARMALCAASQSAAPDRERWLRDAEKTMTRLPDRRRPTDRWALNSIRVGIAAMRGRDEEVLQLLEALAREEAEEGWVVRQLALWVLGHRRGDIEGKGQVERAKAALAARGVAPDERLFGVLFPGLPPLGASGVSAGVGAHRR